MFLSRLFGRRGADRKIARAHLRSIAAQSRNPVFYADNGVHDTFDGRFELMTLHAVLVLRRLKASGEGGDRIAQEILTLMFSDFDHALRESGTGDLTLGKKVRVLGESYLGRAKAYDRAILNGKGELQETLHRNLFEMRDSNLSAEMTDYVLAVVERLDVQGDDDLLQGKTDWPAPSDYIH